MTDYDCCAISARVIGFEVVPIGFLFAFVSHSRFVTLITASSQQTQCVASVNDESDLSYRESNHVVKGK